MRHEHSTKLKFNKYQRIMSPLVYIGAWLWSFLEATVFFVAADFYLSIVGQHNLKRGLIAVLYATLGALVGGTLMYYWASTNPQAAVYFQESILSQSQAHSTSITQSIEAHGMWSYAYGNIAGLPYSMYAVLAPVAGVGFLQFFFIGALIRLMRFSLSVTIIHYLSKALPKQINQRMRVLILLLGWSVFYGWYWGLGI